MTERIDEECRMLHCCDASHTRDKETANSATHSSVHPTNESRKYKTGEDGDQYIVFLLPADKWVTHEIIHVIPWRLDLAAKHDPTNVSVPETFRDVVRIAIRIDKLVVTTMIGGPSDDVVFKSRSTKNKRQESHWP